MIKINILGDKTALDNTAVLMMFVYLFLLVGLLATCTLMYFGTIEKNKTLVAEKTSLESELNNLYRRTTSVKELDKKRKILKSKLGVLARLKNSKVGPVRVLDDLNNSTPDEVWLLGIDEKNGGMTITGRAITPQDVASFMDNLQKSDYFDVDDLKTSLVYMNKQSGQVSTTPTASNRESSGDNKNSRVVQENTMDETNLKIQEFSLAANVYFMGKEFAKRFDKNDESEEEK